MIEITYKISISVKDLTFKTSRSGGPGGQNVNKLNTRVTLFFDVVNYNSFSEHQKRQILARLASRADRSGVIRVVSQKFRTQKANRSAAIDRLQQLLQDALRTKPIRRKTKVPRSARERRLKQKRHHSLLKEQRTRKDWLEESAD
jgi:ribosome-associated protein